MRGSALKSALEVRCREIALRSVLTSPRCCLLTVHKGQFEFVSLGIESFSVCNSARDDRIVRVHGRFSPQLVAAENAPNRGFSAFAASFEPGPNQIRGHDENGRTTAIRTKINADSSAIIRV